LDNTPIRIRPCKKRLYEEFAGDDDEPPKVTSRHNTGPVFTQFSYRIFPDRHNSYLWYKDWTFDSTLDVEDNVIKDRYPRLAKFYFEWCGIYETAFGRPEYRLGINADVFPRVEELVAWATEGFLIACWLSLQDNVVEVKYDPLIDPTGYRLVKGKLEEELVRFLTDMEALLLEKSSKNQG
jgi:hypothetical protein